VAEEDPVTLTVGSLFSGIGGLELGLERAGMRTVFQVERDPYACKVLAKHWPNVPRFSDVREVGAHNLPACDVLCGGFPCQDISTAGKRAGIDGERSGLWSEYARIVRELRPRYVLVENVSALLVRGLERVLGDLAACGYDAEWDCIPAAAVGAPHRRDRIFVVAYAGGTVVRQQPEFERGGRGQTVAGDHGEAGRVAHASLLLGHGGNDHSGGDREGCGTVSEPRDGGCHADVADAPIFRTGEPTNEADAEPEGGYARPLLGRGSWWRTEPDVGRVAHGVPARVDRLRCLGNAVVPQVAEVIGRLIVEFDARRAA
jgi:DNA (cytosine-5)-methyltransferase 1